MRLLDQCLTDNRAVLQHILKVDQIAVVLLLRIVIRVVEMNDSFLMRLNNVLRQKDTLGQVLRHLARHIVALRGVDDRILVGVLLLDLLILLIDQCQNAVVGGVGLTGNLSLVAVADILLCNLVAPHLHDAGLYHILNILYTDSMGSAPYLLGNVVCNRIDLVLVHLIDAAYLCVCLLNCVDNLRNIEVNLLPISLNNVCLHH